MAVSRRLRFEILKRDGYTCRYCGAKAPDATLTIDHVIPVALGGGDEPNNLVTACDQCNGGKASVHPEAELVEDVDATAMLFAKAMTRAAEIQRADAQSSIDISEEFWASWDDFTFNAPTDRDAPRSIDVFISLGLTLEDLRFAREKAFLNTQSKQGVWKYFCGVCWGMIKERQELARQLIEDGQV